jgi:DNA repair and recombination protein RAD54B
MKSRTPGCNKTDLELGRGRSAQLNKTSKGFILRRDASVISKFLPPKRSFSHFSAAPPGNAKADP